VFRTSYLLNENKLRRN